MSPILIIGDTHLHDRFPGYLDAQIKSLRRIIKDNEDCESVIFLGDIFEKRKPSPAELIAFGNFLYSTRPYTKFYIIKGNHDMERKSDDSVTCLSLFSYIQNSIVLKPEIITSVTDKIIEGVGIRFIPFYEDENKIREAITSVGKDQIIIGHFGFLGSLNTMGIGDFTINPSSICNDCILGHIHKFKKVDKITVLGTPYTTNFGEQRKDCYIAKIETDGIRYIRNNQGPRHYVCNIEDLENKKDDINDPDYFTLLRVLINKINDKSISTLKEDLSTKYNVKYVDVKFNQMYESKQRSSYNPKINLSEINEGVIEKYIDESNTKITKDSLIKGLNELKVYKNS